MNLLKLNAKFMCLHIFFFFLAWKTHSSYEFESPGREATPAKKVFSCCTVSGAGSTQS